MPYIYKDGLPLCKKSGVYAIVNERNGKVYVGSAVSVRGRLQTHRSGLRRGCHENIYLQRAWDKHGEESFRFDVLQVCASGDCVVTEQYWIDKLESTNRRKGYNLVTVAGGGWSGCKHTEELKAKWSAERKGMDTSRATEAAAEANRGKKRPQEIRNKISVAQKGKTLSEEHKENLKATHWSKGPNAVDIVARIQATKDRLANEAIREEWGTTS